MSRQVFSVVKVTKFEAQEKKHVSLLLFCVTILGFFRKRKPKRRTGSGPAKETVPEQRSRRTLQTRNNLGQTRVCVDRKTHGKNRLGTPALDIGKTWNPSRDVFCSSSQGLTPSPVSSCSDAWQEAVWDPCARHRKSGTPGSFWLVFAASGWTPMSFRCFEIPRIFSQNTPKWPQNAPSRYRPPTDLAPNDLTP